MNEGDIKIVPDAKAIAEHAAALIVGAAAQAIQLAGNFTIALSGGSTPKTLFELLATEEYLDQIDWTRVEVFFGDERVVGPDNPESNYRMTMQALLIKLPIPEQNVHRMRGEINPTEAAIEYGQLLKQRFGDEGGLDLALLGMGDDGHTASLFPHTEALNETRHRCIANFVPKLNAWRITMSAPFLNRSREVIALVSGEKKSPVLRDVLQGPRDPERLPIQMISPTHGKMIWLIDEAAAKDLSSV